MSKRFWTRKRKNRVILSFLLLCCEGAAIMIGLLVGVIIVGVFA